jgi:hypothetical protein
VSRDPFVLPPLLRTPVRACMPVGLKRTLSHSLDKRSSDEHELDSLRVMRRLKTGAPAPAKPASDAGVEAQVALEVAERDLKKLQLDPVSEQAKAELKEAEAKLKEAEAKLKEAKTELDKAKAELKEAKTELDKAKADGDEKTIKRANAAVERADDEVARVQAEVKSASARMLELEATVTRLLAANQALVLTDFPPSLEVLRAEFIPLLASVFLTSPAPKSVPTDMRFYPAHRPAAVEIVDRLPEKSTGSIDVMMLIAVSGSGKTSAIFSAGVQMFTMYMACTPQMTEVLSGKTTEDYSTAFSTFEGAVDRALMSAEFRTDRGKQKNTQVAIRLAGLFIAAHLLTLYLFLAKFEDATPFQFLQYQLTALGQSFVAHVFAWLMQRFSWPATSELAILLREALYPLLAKRGLSKTFLLAVDEMEGAATIKDEYFMSRTGKPGRGLLSPLLQACRDLADFGQYSIIVSGTGSTLARADSVTSDIGKKGNVTRIQLSKFPPASEHDVFEILGRVTELSKQQIRTVIEVPKYLVGGRFRLTARAAMEFKRRPASESAMDRLVEAVHLSVNSHKESLERALKKYIDNEPDAVKRQLHLDTVRRVYVVSKMSGGRMPFESEEDLCRVGIAVVDEAKAFFVRELFVMETIVDYFEAQPDLAARSAFAAAVDDLEMVLRTRGAAASGKGDLLENVVFHALRQDPMQGLVLQLPLVQLDGLDRQAKARAAKAWGGVRFVCEDVQPLGAADQDAASFLAANPHVLLSPETTHRADGCLLLGPHHMLQLGVKFYSNAVPSEDVSSQFRSTDPAAAYEKANGHLHPADPDRFNENAKQHRDAWLLKGLDKRIALRLHVCIPRAAVKAGVAKCKVAPGTFVMEDGSIVVNLDKTNLRLLLGWPTGASEDARVLRAVYRLLYQVTGVEEFKV